MVFLLTNTPSESMLDTLQVGDKVYGNRLAYLKEEPERGDNRNDSWDARFWENTYVEREALVARAECVYFPFRDWKDLNE